MALKEVCIAARSFGDGRAQEGDIILVRGPLGHVGKKEQGDFLWLLIDESELPAEVAFKGADERHNISLDDLKARHPALDLARVRDSRDKYQPMLNINPADGRARASVQTSGVAVSGRPNPFPKQEAP